VRTVTKASAAGKVILLGEHAVVYGRPAIAVPVNDVRATAEIVPLAAGEGVLIVAEDLGLTCRLDQVYEVDAARALQTTVRNTLECLGVQVEGQALRIVARSQIPIARGMGSGTAVATALVRALAKHYGRHLTTRAVSDLVFKTEVILHGTPSGIDNTVVAFEKPVYFEKGRRADVFWIGRSFDLVIADTGVPSKTRDAVEDVRRAWLSDRSGYETLFDRIGAIVQEGRQALIAGQIEELGHLMDRNQLLLQELGVSSLELDDLIAAARSAGAKGAKLSGGGRGGCMIALVDDHTRDRVIPALLLAGASSIMATTVR